MSKSNLVHVGTFGSPIGLKGEIKVKMLTSSFEFFKMLKVYLNEDASETWHFKITSEGADVTIIIPLET